MATKRCASFRFGQRVHLRIMRSRNAEVRRRSKGVWDIGGCAEDRLGVSHPLASHLVIIGREGHGESRRLGKSFSKALKVLLLTETEMVV